MDDRKTLEAKLLGRGSMVLDVQCYCCVYVVHVVYSVIVPMVMCNVVYVVLCTYDVVCKLHIWCCVYITYVVLGIDGVTYMLDMRCCVHIVLCACCICDVVCI